LFGIFLEIIVLDVYQPRHVAASEGLSQRRKGAVAKGRDAMPALASVGVHSRLVGREYP